MRGPLEVEIRPYAESDAGETLAVFLDAIARTASADYTPEQVEAWADPEGRELSTWHAARAGRPSFVAVVAGRVVGFSDVGDDGHIDMMFVAPEAARRGVGAALLAHAEASARERGTGELSADVSITARPLFESRGFAVVAEQHPVRRGVALTNFRMTKSL